MLRIFPLEVIINVITMAAASSDPYVGTRIREYEILDVIGKGGMGAVYRARHVYLDEERAIKVVHSEFAEDEAFLQRFIREAKMLVKLRHRNLVQLFEFGTLKEDTFFMVLELIRGDSLLDRVSKLTRVPIHEALKIIREAALGLHMAHQKGIVHRDISPDNILVVKDEEGNDVTKVIDFGIAKPLADQSRIFTRTNMFLGKPEFCSPEQCGRLEEGEVIDHRSDIYSLGITFYYALTGKLPFYSPTSQGYLVKHVTEAPKSISLHFPSGHFPVQLEHIIVKMLAKDRDERYATMDELAKALQEFTSPSPPPQPVKPSAKSEIRSSELAPGSVFERRYVIEKLLRKGTKGIFYKAIDNILDVPIVLKLITTEMLADAKAKERFKRAILLSHKLRHPNVCRIFDVGESDDGLFISMEYVEGQSLSDLVRSEKKLKNDVAFQIVKDLLSAIKEANHLGIIHRNLKPQNIMIDSKFHAHILDFGSAITALALPHTEPSQYFGASVYTAPEMLISNTTDHRSDLYSIGVILYELITGVKPFVAQTLPALIFSHMNNPPKKPSEVAPEIHPALEAMILKSIEKDLALRYQTAEEMLSELERIKILMAAPKEEIKDLTLGKDATKKLKNLFEKGKEFYDQLRLEEALETWRQALAIKPHDAMVKKCIAAAENRIVKETQIRSEVKALIAECEKYLDAKNFQEAKKTLDACERKITGGPRFKDVRDRIYILWQRMDVMPERKPSGNFGSGSFSTTDPNKK